MQDCVSQGGDTMAQRIQRRFRDATTHDKARKTEKQRTTGQHIPWDNDRSPHHTH